MGMRRFEERGKQRLESAEFSPGKRYSGQNHSADVLIRGRGFRDALAFLQPFIEGIDVAWAHAV
jgi:hypothetical protein